jgi:hypothetical protein
MSFPITYYFLLIRKSILFFVLVLIATPSTAQQFLQGNVADSNTNLPLEGATVTLLPSKISTVTNANGKFIFKKI